MRLNLVPALLLAFTLGAHQAGSRADESGDPTNLRKDALIVKALLRAVVEEKDVADYDLLPDKRQIVLLNKTDWGRAEGSEITERALPKDNQVQFVLQSNDEIQRRANESGDFLYLAVGGVIVETEVGIIRVGTQWARAEDSQKIYLSGGGYELRYRWHEGSWVFDRILSAWIS